MMAFGVGVSPSFEHGRNGEDLRWQQEVSSHKNIRASPEQLPITMCMFWVQRRNGN
jgi:hypothetical protein